MRMPGIVSAQQAGGGSYTAKAVHFDGTALLKIASLACTDGATFSMVGWLKPTDNSNAPIICVTDPNGDYTTNVELFSFSGVVNNNAVDASLYSVGEAAQMEEFTANGSFPYGSWQCLLLSANASTGAFQVFNGDTDISAALQVDQHPFTLTNNGKPFYIGSDADDPATGQTYLGDMADLRIMPGAFIDFTVQANRRYFIDGSGKPINPATATAHFGAPVMLFSGDHTTFPVNQGSGGAFTLTGILTDAATHP